MPRIYSVTWIINCLVSIRFHQFYLLITFWFLQYLLRDFILKDSCLSLLKFDHSLHCISSIDHAVFVVLVKSISVWNPMCYFCEVPWIFLRLILIFQLILICIFHHLQFSLFIHNYFLFVVLIISFEYILNLKKNLLHIDLKSSNSFHHSINTYRIVFAILEQSSSVHTLFMHVYANQ